jgi:hypothetical protein
VQQEDETGEGMFEIKEMKVRGGTRMKWNNPWVFLWWNTLPPPPPRRPSGFPYVLFPPTGKVWLILNADKYKRRNWSILRKVSNFQILAFLTCTKETQGHTVASVSDCPTGQFLTKFVTNYLYSNIFFYYNIHFFVTLRPNAGHGLLILSVSRSHTTTHHSR